jgi:hypothetical protein
MIGMGALKEQLPRAGQGARTFGLGTGRSYLAVARFATTARAPPRCPEMARAGGWLHRPDSPTRKIATTSPEGSHVQLIHLITGPAGSETSASRRALTAREVPAP